MSSIQHRYEHSANATAESELSAQRVVEIKAQMRQVRLDLTHLKLARDDAREKRYKRDYHLERLQAELDDLDVPGSSLLQEHLRHG